MKKGIELPSLWWADIEGYEGLYRVSVDGEVKSLERIDSNGHPVKERILKPLSTGTGYLFAILYKDGKSKHFKIHRLVAQAFLDNPDNLPCVNHINEIKTDNRVENLEWCTYKYNNNYGTAIQRKVEKQSKPVVALDKQGRIAHVFPSAMEAERNGFSQGHVSACCRGDKGFKTHKGLIWKYKDDYLKKTC